MSMVLHPGVITALKRLTSDELGVARLMAAGEITSPQTYENVELFAVRVTGTGLSYRQGLDEHVWRNPEHYCNDEFLARCSGLPILWEHPPRAVLDGDEFARRIIGTVFLPYVQGSEVWAIAKIYDREAAKMMEEGQLSTSPSVVFRDETVNDRIQSGDGRSLLFEGKPSLLDHLAVCERGVWDKGGAPAGVRSDNVKDEVMKKRADGTDEPEDKGAGDGEKLDKLLEHLGSMSSSMENLTARMDALEAKGKADSAKDEETEEEKRARLSEEAKRSDSSRADSYTQRHAAEAANELALANIQARADSAFNLHGKRAPAPMAGETQTAYRLRTLRDHQRFSPSYKAVNLAAIAHADPAAFDVIEGQIFADSAAEANRPTMFADDQIRCRTRFDKDLDRNVREFFGPHTFAKELGTPARPVVSINLDPNRVFRAA